MAEGIRISEFEEAETLQDGCCFPVVSEGVNKRITKSTLFNLFKNEMKGFILETFYPVGHIYLTLGDENPATLFGGTWEREYMYTTSLGGNEKNNPVRWKNPTDKDNYSIKAWKRTA